MTHLPWILALLLAAVAALAAIYDARWRRIPNWLTMPGVLAGIGLNWFLYGSAGLRGALLGLLLAFAIYFPLYLLRGMGAGDVKLMAAVGAIAGPANWIAIFMLTGLIGGLLVVTLVLRRRRLLKTFTNAGILLREIAHLRAPYARHAELDVNSPAALTLPHGLAIALGCVGYLVAASLWLPG